MIAQADIPAVTALYDKFGLTAKEALVVLLLARNQIVNPVRIRDVYCDHPDTTPIEARSAVKRIRAKTKPVIRIRTHYGIGYELEPDSRKQVRQIISHAGSIERIPQCLASDPARSHRPTQSGQS
jgi:hypothetical protein